MTLNLWFRNYAFKIWRDLNIGKHLFPEKYTVTIIKVIQFFKNTFRDTFEAIAFGRVSIKQ